MVFFLSWPSLLLRAPRAAVSWSDWAQFYSMHTFDLALLLGARANGVPVLDTLISAMALGA